MPYAQKGRFYACHNSNRERKLLKCGQFYIQTQWMPMLLLAKVMWKSLCHQRINYGQNLGFQTPLKKE